MVLKEREMQGCPFISYFSLNRLNDNAEIVRNKFLFTLFLFYVYDCYGFMYVNVVPVSINKTKNT